MNILIVDDHPVLREGLKKMALQLEDVVRVDEASCGDSALKMIKQRQYDLITLDINLPGISGLEILEYLHNHKASCRSIIISLHPAEHFAGRAFGLGASGYISKDASLPEIREAIGKVAGGGKYIPEKYTEILAFGTEPGTPPHERLSTREFQVMVYLAKGKSVSEIGSALHISDKTVSTYRKRILQKMELQNNTELTIYAYKNNIIH